MVTVNYYYDDNTVGIEVIEPPELDKKRSETFVELQCDTCHGTTISTDISGDMLVILCHSCDNYWTGDLARVLHFHKSGEAYTRFSDTGFSNM